MAGGSTGNDGLPAGLRTTVALAATLIVPAAVLLMVVGVQSLEPPATGVSLPGYTCSLSLFLVPASLLFCWLLNHAADSVRQAFWIALGLLASIGLILDLLFGPRFFVWPNQRAVIGLMVPAIGGQFPVEEVIFFVSGFAFLLLAYVWSDCQWLAAYHPMTTKFAPSRGAWLLRAALVLLVLLTLAGAIAYKRLQSAEPGGFPGYMAYVLLVAILPPVYCLPAVLGAINWRAFSVTQLAMILVCLFWEVTLAIPNQWWGFRPEMMTGIYISAWSDLPIEEPFVWIASPFTVVIVYEAVRLRQRHGADGTRMLLGLSRRSNA